MKQSYLKFWFSCYNEYTDEIIQELRKIFNINQETNPLTIYRKEGIDWSVRLIYESGISAFIITTYRDEYRNVISIFLKEENVEKVKELLFQYREIMIEEYGEDHIKEIKLRDNEDFLYLKELGKQYGFYENIKEFLI